MKIVHISETFKVRHPYSEIKIVASNNHLPLLHIENTLPVVPSTLRIMAEDFKRIADLIQCDEDFKKYH